MPPHIELKVVMMNSKKPTVTAETRDAHPESMVVRFGPSNFALAKSITDIAESLERSKHWVAVQALKRGLAEMENDELQAAADRPDKGVGGPRGVPNLGSDVELKSLNVRMPEPVRVRLKTMAAAESRSLRELVTEALWARFPELWDPRD